MAAKLWEGCFNAFRDANDDPASGALAYFYAAGTSTDIVVYSDDALATPRTQPVVASASGRFPQVFLPYQSYRVKVTDASGVSLLDIDGIANPEPPDAGGGGGVVVTAGQLPLIGDFIWRPATGTRAGWVRSNGRTIGSPSSGATERANADCAGAYAFLWDSFSDAECPVGGGRGASASADFAANKPIGTLDMAGYLMGGLDAMGSSAANRLQVSTTITTSLGSATATVASAAGLARGMYVVATTIPAGVTITAISGTTITLSSGTSVTAGTGTAARFSFFTDAQTAGAKAGSPTTVQTETELAAHAHSGTVNVSGSANVSGTVTGSQNFNDILNVVTGSTTINYAPGAASQGVITALGSSSTPNTISFTSGTTVVSASGTSAGSGSFSTAAVGSSLPLRTLPPTRLGTYYMKI